MLSVSATFAADEDITLTEVDDGIITDENVLSVEEDANELNVADESVVGIDETSDVVGASSTITNDTFFNYFENDGTLRSNVTSDELIFEGDFSNISGVNYILINKSIKLSGKNAVLNNIPIVINASNVIIDSFTINVDNSITALSIEDMENITISNNKINFIGIVNDNDATAIFLDTVKNLNITANVVTFTGKGNKTGNQALYLVDSENVVIDGNTFIIETPSTGYMVGSIDLEGFNIEFTNNNVTINGISTDYTLNGICFTGNNITIAGNNLTCTGNMYTYGIGAYGSNSQVINNKINVSSNIYYACGIDLEGYGLTTVENNNFIISSVGAAYGIYSGMTYGGLSGYYTNNNITVDSYFAVGVELGSTDETLVGNTIDVAGNYTVGVAAIPSVVYMPPTYEPVQITIANRLVKNNNITVKGSNSGYQSTGDSYVSTITAGVFAAIGNITFTNNTINSNANGVYASAADNVVFNLNNVVVNGIKAVDFIDCMDAVVDDNTFVVVVPSTGYQTGALNFNDGTSNLKFTNNVVDVVGSEQSMYSTTCAIAFAGNNVTLEKNSISASNDTYTYAIVALGTNSSIADNSIKASSPNYACGVNLEGADVTVVDNNNIIVSSDAFAYGIYSGMTSGGLVGVYSNNNITATAYFAVGVELGSTDETVVGNTIDVAGNYTVGVGEIPSVVYMPPTYEPTQMPIQNRLIKDNNIAVKGSNVGNESTGDSYLKQLQSVGIWDTAGNSTIEGNTIKSTGDYAIDLTDVNSTVKTNYLESAKGTGANAINSKGNATIDVKVKTSFEAASTVSVLLTQVKSGYYYKVVLKDANGKVLAKATITINGQTFTTDDQGIVNYKLSASKAGTQTLTLNYAGDSQYVATTMTATVTITKEATKITAKKKTFKAKKKTKKYTATLKDSKGKAISKAKVTLKLKGKKAITAKTNAKGVVTFKIKKLNKKGTYKGKVTYAGSDLYKASSAKVKITVKK